MNETNVPRPQAGDGSSTGTERYLLIKAAFQHAERSFLHGYYLEAIATLESIIADRLGSMLQGSLGRSVTLRDTVSGLMRKVGDNVPAPSDAALESAGRAPLPDDVTGFLDVDLKAWWSGRNEAVHGMAKLRRVGDSDFVKGYETLATVALEGFRVLEKLDLFDQREKAANLAGHSATWPDALHVGGELRSRLAAVQLAPT